MRSLRAIEDADYGLGSYAPARVNDDDSADLAASACRALCPEEPASAPRRSVVRDVLGCIAGLLACAVLCALIYTLIEGWHR